MHAGRARLPQRPRRRRAAGQRDRDPRPGQRGADRPARRARRAARPRDGRARSARRSRRASDLPALVEQAREAGVHVELADRLPRDAPVPDVVGRTLYRIVQEGITNAGKHAPGAVVRIEVSGSPDEGVDIVLRNPLGLRAARGTPGSGLGLIGLAERAELRGGRLEGAATGSSSCCAAGYRGPPVTRLTRAADRRRRPARPLGAHLHARRPARPRGGRRGRRRPRGRRPRRRAAARRRADGHPDAAAQRPRRHPLSCSPPTTHRG